MIICSVKLRRGKWLAGALGLCVLVLAAIFTVRALGGGAKAPGEVKAPTDADRVAYLKELGWEAEETPLAVEELLIPQEFDDTYTQYLDLQAGQGFDLTAYKGERVKRYSYAVTNYPTGEPVQAGLLVYRDRIVGGELLSNRVDGFLLPLSGQSPS